MSVWAIVVAGGTGSRFGARKQYESLGGRRVLDWAIEAARSVAEGIVIAVPPDRLTDDEPAADAVVPGGPRRSDSVRNALARVPVTADTVVVHDAARPLATPRLFAAVVAALDDADGAVPGVPLADTVKRVRDGQVIATLDRSELVAVQTPQAFRAGVLRRAHAGGDDATDDAALVEAIGGRVIVVAGDAANVKLTTLEDLVHAEHRVSSGRPGP